QLYKEHCCVQRVSFGDGRSCRYLPEMGQRSLTHEECTRGTAAQFSGGGMDILVMLEENPDHSPVLAHVNSVPSPLHSSERPSRDIVTLYGEPNPESVALALAAAVESHRSGDGRVDSIRHLGIWPERGAVGD